MGFFSAESKSKTSTVSQNATVQSDNGSSSSAVSTGARSVVANNGGIVVQRVGKKANVTFTSTDYGAIAGANAVVMETLRRQAGVADAAVMGLNQLAETKITDGANLNQKTTQLGVVIFGIMGVIIAVVFFLRR